MKYRITTVRDIETGRIIYWRAEYKANWWSSWKPVRDKNPVGQHESLRQALEAITEHLMRSKFEELVSFKEEFV